MSESESARRAAEESALIDSARGGSQAAFEALYRRHVRKVYGLCLRMSADRTIAEDCTQEAFVQAWRALPAFEGRSAFGSWLHRIAVNAVLAQGRRRRADPCSDTATEDEIAALADPRIVDGATAIDLEGGLRGLPSGARQALVLVGLYGHSYEEAAGMLGISVGTCKSQVHRARQLLGERLGHGVPER